MVRITYDSKFEAGLRKKRTVEPKRMHARQYKWLHGCFKGLVSLGSELLETSGSLSNAEPKEPPRSRQDSV